MKKGDLAFIPSEVTLKQFKKENGALHKYYTLKKPSPVVVLKEVDNFCETKQSISHDKEGKWRQ